jgi:hypothetical protein
VLQECYRRVARVLHECYTPRICSRGGNSAGRKSKIAYVCECECVRVCVCVCVYVCAFQSCVPPCFRALVFLEITFSLVGGVIVVLPLTSSQCCLKVKKHVRVW